MKLKKVLELAKGRIWTGLDAKKNGLIDELGTIEDAIEYAKKITAVGKKVQILYFPRPKSLFDILSSSGISSGYLPGTLLNVLSPKERNILIKSLKLVPQLRFIQFFLSEKFEPVSLFVGPTLKLR